MDARSAAHALSQVAMLLELHGEPKSTVQNFQLASRSLATLSDDALGALLATQAPALSADALRVIRELVETNGSELLESLQERTPEGLLEMLLVPGLGPAKIRLIHDGLHIDTLQELEQAARDGRLAALPRFGDKTAEKIQRGISDLRSSGAAVLWPHANSEAQRLSEIVAAHASVQRVAVAGSIRRRCELVHDVELVVAVTGSPSVVAASIAHALPGVRDVLGGGGHTLSVRFTDGIRLDIVCVRPEHFAVALWRATGSDLHARAVVEHAASLGFTFASERLLSADGTSVLVTSEPELYATLQLQFVEPELREAAGETQAAQHHALPNLVSDRDIVGAVHCHSQYSDGGATIAEMANAAIGLGWKYLGVSDHSQSNTYAGGLARDAILRQHEEIALLNQEFELNGTDFRILQGIEADILPCGRVDYDAQFLERFDFVIASIHSRYGMDLKQMTERVLKALDDPHLTILGHPTGRLLLTREPYAIDMEAVMEKAGTVGVAIELNADPHRVDIDWRMCRLAKRYGALVSIGPDAHSPAGLSNASLGVATARKGWLEAPDILNSRTAGEVVEFARARRVMAAH